MALVEAALLRSTAEATNRVVIPNVRLDSETDLNDVVFFNQATDKYEPALAGAVYSAGAFKNIAASVAVGIVVKKNGTRGDVMVGGYDVWPDSDPEQFLEAGLTFKAGVPYFLSAVDAGKLTHIPPAYRIQVLVATDLHFVVAPAYATLESFQDSFPVSIGMRPVGSLRSLAPLHQQVIIVGFDGLEKDATSGLWSSTRQGIATHATSGWVIADASITNKPSGSFFVEIKVTTGGVVSVKHAASLEDASTDSDWYGSTQTASGVLDGDTYGTVREANLYDPQSPSSNPIGTLRYKFTSGNIAKERRIVLQVPESFQGWKMVQEPVMPEATAYSSGGVLTRVDVTKPGVGMLTAPSLSFVGGTGAVVVATLDDNGGLAGIAVTSGGTGYTNNRPVTFDSKLITTKILNGGSGAAFTVSLTSTQVSSVAVTDGGSNYWMPPVLEVVDDTGAGTGAVLRAVVEAGEVIAVEVLEGGSGYAGSGSTTVRTRPSYYGYRAGSVLLRASNCGDTPPTLTAVPSSGMRLAGVKVLCGGWDYDAGTDIVVSNPPGGAPDRASVQPVINADGEIVSLIVTNPGVGYTSNPTFTISNPVNGHGLRLEPLMETDLTGVTIATPGTGLTRRPTIEAGVPVRDYRLISGGSGYTDATYDVTVTAPEFSGATQAAVTAYRGGRVTAVEVSAAGSGYTDPVNTSVVFDLGAVDHTTLVSDPAANSKLVDLVPLFEGGQLVAIRILRAGRGLVALKKWTEEPVTANISTDVINLTGHGLLDGQRITLKLDGSEDAEITGGLAVDTIYYVRDAAANTFKLATTSGGSAIDLVTDAGSGVLLTSIDTYEGTISAAEGLGGKFEILVGDTDAIVELVSTNKGTGYIRPPKLTMEVETGGEAAQAYSTLQGNGLLVEPTISGEGMLTGTNGFQVKSWSDDFGLNYVKPAGCGLYYNAKADPDFRLNWPSTPIGRSLVSAGGVELRSSEVNATTGALDTQADIGLLSKTIAWRGLPRLGAPWDPNWQLLVNDLNSDGTDTTFRPGNSADQGWRWWSRLTKNEGQIGTGVVHVNKSSHAAQSGRVQSLTVLPPLKLVDTLVGLDNGARPGPMTGQLTLTLDTEENLLSPWSPQIDTTRAGSRVAVYQNNTGRPVFLKSLQIRSVFQVNQTGATAQAVNAAKVIAGTASGAYRDIVGVPDPTQTTTPGKSLCLFASGQIKELFPDADSAAPVLAPGEVVYLVVDAPAAPPIVTQLVTVRVMGHAL